MTQTKWQDLLVSDEDGAAAGDTLGKFVDICPSSLDNVTIEDGKITSWPGFMLSAPGEEPDWDTPRGDVDWSGFQEALGIHDDEPGYPWLSIEQYVLEGLALDVKQASSQTDAEIRDGINEVSDQQDGDEPYDREDVINEAIRLARNED